MTQATQGSVSEETAAAEPRPAAHRRPGRIAAALPAVLSFVVMLGLWEMTARWLQSLVFPPVTEIAIALADLITSGVLFEHLVISGVTLVAGLAIAIVIGITVGALMGIFSPIEKALDVYVNAAMAAPMIAFVPIFILLFGLGYPTRILTVIIFALFPIIINAYTGVRNVDRSLEEMARSFGATRRQVVLQVQLRAAFPYLLAAIRLGTGRGIKGLINGEVLVTVVGLGGLVKTYGTAFSMDYLYAIIFFIVALALLTIRAVDHLTRHVGRQ